MTGYEPYRTSAKVGDKVFVEGEGVGKLVEKYDLVSQGSTRRHPMATVRFGKGRIGDVLQVDIGTKVVFKTKKGRMR